MAFGGIAAFVLFRNKQKLLNIIFSKSFQILLYAVTITLVVLGRRFPNFTFEIYSIFFAMIILNLAGNKNSIFSLEFKWLSYLGKISYGIYMYHILMIAIAIKTLQYFGLYNTWSAYGLSFGLTIGVSVLSYEFYEKKFIKAKVRYSTVVSGDNVKDKEKVIAEKQSVSSVTPALDLVSKPKGECTKKTKIGMMETEYQN